MNILMKYWYTHNDKYVYLMKINVWYQYMTCNVWIIVWTPVKIFYSAVTTWIVFSVLDQLNIENIL